MVIWCYCLFSDKDPASVETENGIIKGSLVSGPQGGDVEEYLGKSVECFPYSTSKCGGKASLQLTRL